MKAARRLGSIFLFLLLTSAIAFSQSSPARIVVLGSSTAEGVGASAGKGWVDLFKAYLASSGITADVVNLACSGYTTFDVLPTDYVSPYKNLQSTWNRSPDPQRNITKALSYFPTDIIVNLPSNDGLLEVPVAYQIAHLGVVQARALAQGVRIWFTTSQPTKWTATKKQIQIGMKDAVFAQFGSFALDFWNGIVSSDATILSQYDAGDGVHVNDKGHAVLFESVRSKVTFSVTRPATTGILDGGFEASPSAWSFVTNGSGTFATVSGGTEGTKAGKVSILTAGTNVQLYQASINLQPNSRYRLSFDAYSSSGHDLALSVNKHVTPFTNYGLSNYVVDLGNAWQSFTINFTTAGFTGVASDARLMFWLTPYQTAGDEYYFDKVTLTATDASIASGVGEDDSSLPSGFALLQNYPNPFNPRTTITFSLPPGAQNGSDLTHVSLRVYDTLGREVSTLKDEPLSAGSHSVAFDASHLASGVYVYRLKAGENVATRRMVLAR